MLSECDLIPTLLALQQGRPMMDHDPGGAQASPRLVALVSLKMPSRPAHPPVGIVTAGEQATFVPTAGAIGPRDIKFPPNTVSGCSSIAITSHGGAIGTADPVQLLFWGATWQTLPDPSTPGQRLLNTFTSAVQSILAGPYMSGLRQYGVKRCPFGGALIVTSPNPPLAPNTFSEDNVQSIIQSLIDQGTFPEPDEPGGRNLYIVVMLPNTQYNQPGIRGSHSSFSTGSVIDPDNAWYAWVGGSNANTLNQMTSAFCHELAEMCSDPEGDAWNIDGQGPNCSEIGDICNLEDFVLNGVNFESYWSIFDNACLIPTAWSLRRSLAGAGIKLSGQGMRSFFGPIPSLNQFIVNL